MFGLIALVLVVAGKVLDYVAPKTKTKADDMARDAVHTILPMLPAAKEARARLEAPAATMPPPAVNISGFKARDHR